MRLQDFSIGTKIVSLVVFVSLSAALVGVTGYLGLDEILGSVMKVADNGDQAVLGARMNQNLLILNRSEYRIAADPSPATIAATEEFVRANRQQFLASANNQDRLSAGVTQQCHSVAQTGERHALRKIGAL